MPRGPAPPWKRRKEPILDHYLQASVNRVNGVYDQNGWYGLLVYAGCESFDRAKEIKQALYRSGQHMNLAVMTDIVEAEDKTWQVHFRAIDKKHARAYVVQKHGTDRSRWPYDPRRKEGK